jgi:hypothetical protein
MSFTAKLTPEGVKRFEGGNLSIINEHEDYHFEGVIQTATVEGEDLLITCSKMERVSGTGGTGDGRLDYAVNISMNQVEVESARIVIRSPYTYETATLTCDVKAALNADTTHPVERKLTKYIGGDIEINDGPGPISDSHRGPITEATVVDEVLVVKCEWVGFRSQSTGRCQATTRKEFRFFLPHFNVGEPDDLGRLMMNAKGLRKLIVFFPVGGKKLSRTSVEGLD